VAKRGNTSHFEGDMLPQKKDPKSWPFIDGHNKKAVKTFLFLAVSVINLPLDIN
jgi:hypothetical protein